MHLDQEEGVVAGLQCLLCLTCSAILLLMGLCQSDGATCIHAHACVPAQFCEFCTVVYTDISCAGELLELASYLGVCHGNRKCEFAFVAMWHMYMSQTVR